MKTNNALGLDSTQFKLNKSTQAEPSQHRPFTHDRADPTGAQRAAAARGIALVAPDTSPRGLGVEGESASWDFGVGAGFYVNATQVGQSRHGVGSQIGWRGDRRCAAAWCARGTWNSNFAADVDACNPKSAWLPAGFARSRVSCQEPYVFLAPCEQPTQPRMVGPNGGPIWYPVLALAHTAMPHQHVLLCNTAG